MTDLTATAPDMTRIPQPRPSDMLPILLTVHLLSLVTGIAMIVGLIPAVIVLLVAGGWS